MCSFETPPAGEQPEMFSLLGLWDWVSLESVDQIEVSLPDEVKVALEQCYNAGHALYIEALADTGAISIKPALLDRAEGDMARFCLAVLTPLFINLTDETEHKCLANFTHTAKQLALCHIRFPWGESTSHLAIKPIDSTAILLTPGPIDDKLAFEIKTQLDIRVEAEVIARLTGEFKPVSRRKLIIEPPIKVCRANSNPPIKKGD